MLPLNNEPGVAGAWDLKAVTTPVAYMAYLPYDPLQIPDKARLNSEPMLVPQPFKYYNALQVDAERKLKIVDVPLNDDGTTLTDADKKLGTNVYMRDGPYVPSDRFEFSVGSFAGAAAILMGRGPHDAPSTVLTRDAEIYVRIYDATNGTVSVGDVLTAVQ